MFGPAPQPLHLRPTLLALAACAALSPHAAWALDLMQAPPGTVQPYVAPNVILSLDNSGSMDEKDMINDTKTRKEVLQDALKAVFKDEDLLPNGKIRLAWQSLGAFGVSGLTLTSLGTAAASSNAANVMRILDKDHRNNFIKYVDAFSGSTWTPTHFMVKRADDYMRAPLHMNGPWADKPGEKLASSDNNNKPLGCRRNYHILLTDGQWNGYYYGPESTYFSASSPYRELDNNNITYPAEDINTDPINYDNQDSVEFMAYGRSAGSLTATGINAIANVLGNDPNIAPKKYPGFTLPDGTAYSRDDPNTWLYRDIDYLTYSDKHEGYLPCRKYKYDNKGRKICDDLKADGTGRRGGILSSLSDWTFKSWSTPLQPPADLSGQVSPLPEYEKAPATETFINPKTKKTATLSKYWNPRYNPASWPHMVTFTIGFSKDAIPINQYRPIGKTADVAANTGVYWNTTTRKNQLGWRKDELLWEQDGPYIADASDANTNNGNKGKLIPPTSTLPYGYDGSFADYAAGRAQWYAVKGGEANQDMWHAAINGRGQFYAVEKGEDLKKAFEQIVRTINTDVQPDITSTATSGSNTSRNDVGKFTGNFEPKNAWKGFVTADAVKNDGTTEPIAGWGGQNTAQKLDALSSVSSRLILSWSDQWVGSKPKGGVSFLWASNQNYLSTEQKLALQKGTDGIDGGASAGESRLNYIRGDQSKEGTDGPNGYTSTKPYRQRKSRQGDIVNSVIWYTGAPVSNYSFKGYTAFIRTAKMRTPMIYVGGNDGMLHGFSAQDGSEKIAYVPQGVIPSLNQLTAPAYNQRHRYFVDGSPMTGDVNVSTDPEAPDWRTLLVGSLGAGGKGYFVLDVSDPDAFSADQAANLAMLDRTRSVEAGVPDCTLSTLSSGQKAACNKAVEEDRDIGHITAQPVLDENNPLRTTQIIRLNNDRWAVVMGNGYNSANQRPVLLIQYLDGNRELLRIAAASADATGTGKAQDNGLMAPRLVDLDGDGRYDIAYAGDNQGNLWKFDLTSSDATQWAVAFSGSPLFSAQGGTQGSPNSRTLAQPVTAVPTVRANDRIRTVGTGPSAKKVPVGGMMVAFGTGRNVIKADENDRNMHTLYAVLDNTRYRRVGSGASERLEVHPGSGTCSPVPAADCVPAPAALGTGVAQAKLVSRKIEEVSNGAFGRVLATTELDWGSHNGWYMDFPTVGERLLKPMEFYEGSNLMTVFSQVPAKGSDVAADVESCESSSVDEERQYKTLINIMDGKRPSIQLEDINGDGLYNASDANISRRQVPPGSITLISQTSSTAVLDKKNNKVTDLRHLPENSLRPSWRQLR